jgi:alpha-1,2-glucosyltransferase
VCSSDLLVVRRRYGLGGLAGIGSMLVRQNNVIWFGFLIMLFLIQEYEAPLRAFLSVRSPRSAWGAIKEFPWRQVIRRSWAFILGILLFAAFLLYNGGMAIGDTGAHPFPAVHLGNMYFLLLLSFFLFFPLIIARYASIGRLISRSRFTIPLLVAFFALMMLTFISDHPYNQGLQSAFFRNRMLAYMMLNVWHLAAAGILMMIALLWMIATPLIRREYSLLYPLTILYLLPSWLIEQRYYLIPFVLFLLFRRSERPAVEWMQAAFSMVFTVVLFYTVAQRWFFL